MKFKFCLVLLLVGLFVGCTSDDPISYHPELKTLVGKWKLTEAWSDVDADPTTDAFDPIYITDGYEITFHENGTFETAILPGYTGGTYKFVNVSSKNLELTFTNGNSKVFGYYFFLNGTTTGLNMVGLHSFTFPEDTYFYEFVHLTRIE
ncbi:hypothetical protein [Flavobacterium stagni]|uniref:Lipocalin-like domain-containing protein n=1 Tax=Flavobacterium stagni TaxID=2506421 RepID=A0A4Q1K3B1_9FLAO|nr:hypothetical protein [Flavobacterium stagni]RXR20276.1 hypothetical protein EQG61_12715 [Flavobacterium stagni]